MNNLISVLVIIFLMIQGCTLSKQIEFNSIGKVKKVMLKEEGAEQFFYWELKDQNFLWEYELGNVAALNKYKDSLKLSLGNDKYELSITKESTQGLEKNLLDNEKNGDRLNALLVHTGSIGQIRKVNYLEAQVLNYQINRFPMFSKPTEFHGFLVKNNKTGLIRVYFGASNTEWPPHPTVLIRELEKEINEGWELIGHLHNHYCKKEEKYIGILAPSLADAQYYKMLKERFQLKSALITNGFHTVAIDSLDFEKFESH